jgi:hypothetical protein
MENRKLDYFLICGYLLFIIGVLYDIFKNGYSNDRIYQVILIVFFGISLIYKIKKVAKRKKEARIDENMENK